MLQPGLLTFPDAGAVGVSPVAPSPGISSAFQPLVLPSSATTSLGGLCQASVIVGSSSSPSQPLAVPAGDASLASASLVPLPASCSLTSKSHYSASLCTLSVLSVHSGADSLTDYKSDSHDEKTVAGLQGQQWKIVGMTSLPDSLPKAALMPPAQAACSNQLLTVESSPARFGLTTPLPKGNEQWTIVGVTSIGQAGSFAAMLPLVSPVGGRVDQSLAKSPAKSSEPDPQNRGDGCGGCGGQLSGNPAGGCSQWKIAGITTLPAMIAASRVNLPNAAVAQPVEDNSPGSRTGPDCLDEGPKWKVIGMTSVSSEKVRPVDPPVSTMPLVSMATTGSLVSIPSAPTPIVGEAGWKVVGVVRLPQTPCDVGLNSRVGSQSSGLVCSDHSSAQCGTHGSRKLLPTTDTPKRESIVSSHPLSFLKNCSSHFRNAVLKKNTVSTMLELKRAYEKRSQLGSRVNPMFSEDISSQGSPASSQQCKGQCMMDSFVNTDDRTVLSELYYSQVMNQSGSQNQLESREKKEKHLETTNQSPESENHAPNSHQETESRERVEREHVSPDGRALYDRWQVFKAEGGELVMAASSEGDRVHLAAVDPWGVCTDDDLEDIAEMMAERGDRAMPSSSRKRKLSTPRKMVQ